MTGTPLYMPPEAITAPETVDARSDIYALGAVGYYVLTGVPVFDGRTLVEVCGHHMHNKPKPPSQRLGKSVPSKLEELLLDCLNKDPAARPQTAADLLERLSACSSNGRWSVERARAWWAQHGDAVTPTSSSDHRGPRTVAVDLERHR